MDRHEYQEALDRINELLDVAEPGTSEGDELDDLVARVEAFEDDMSDDDE